jgi:hypothetical protein
MVKSAKKIKIKFIWASSARNGSFWVFFEKKGVKSVPLSWYLTCSRLIHVGAWYTLAPDMFALGICWRLVHVGTRHVGARHVRT